MSAGPDEQTIEMERRRLTQRLDEVARLCEADVAPATFYGELLKRLLESLAAPAGAVWVRTAQGNLQQQFQINLKEAGLDRSEETRTAHLELLRRAVMQPAPAQTLALPPHSGAGAAEDGKPVPGNPTDFLLLMAPIVVSGQVAGLVEVFQGANRPQAAVRGFLQYMQLMADLAGRYGRNQMLGQMAGQQQLWTQLETFARQVHTSLNPVEVAYQVANEGRRLVSCDRVSVVVRYGQKVAVEAISGADVVEKRSNLVRLMRELGDQVIRWGEKLVFTGVKDDSLPPKVLHALDAYLAESASKLLVVQPLHDEREGEKGKKQKKARTALFMECFEPPAEPQQLVARMDVVGRHATSALYNAVEHRRIPMRWVWMPLAAIQDGLGGKSKAIATLVVAGLALLGSVLFLAPYPLKMDATGRLVPQVRRVVYSPTTGKIVTFLVRPGEQVKEGAPLAILFDEQLRDKVTKIRTEMDNYRREAEEFGAQATSRGSGLTPGERSKRSADAIIKGQLALSKQQELNNLQRTTNARIDSGNEGSFTLRAPSFSEEERALLGRHEWTVLNSDFRNDLTGRGVKPSDPILQLGAKDGPWEIEMKIPQKHAGQVFMAFDHLKSDELDVDFLLRSDSTRTFRGRLERGRLAGEANPSRDDNNESEPVVLGYVRVGDAVPTELLTSGTEVHAKVRCGNHRMGYSLFYGVWEFFYEKVVFFF